MLGVRNSDRLGLATRALDWSLTANGASAFDPKPFPREIAMTTLEANKALARRSLEMWASGYSDDPAEIFTVDYINHQEPAAAGGVKGIDLKT
jgi:hypothetical protein